MKPNKFNDFHIAGVTAYLNNKPLESVKFFRQAIKLNPFNFEVYNNFALALRALKHLDDALMYLDKALKLNPQYASAMNNKGLVLQDMLKYEESIQSYKSAIHLNKNYFEAHYNCGLALMQTNRLSESESYFNNAVSLNPQNASAHLNLSLVRLLQGNFNSAWHEYEWRWKIETVLKDNPVSKYKSQLWLGNYPLEGKTILLHAEQGLGDTIQFARYIRFFQQLKTTVVLEIQKPLYSLFNGIEGVSELISQGSKLPHYDFHCPLMSLPLAFNTDFDSIPAPTEIKKSDQHTPLKISSIFSLNNKPKIGFVWKGAAGHKNDKNRSVALAQFQQIFKFDAQFISLQKDITPEEKLLLEQHPNVTDSSELIDDFSDTATICRKLDLLISVDTSVAHLAASLNINTWILLPFAPDWRWMLNTNDSPWYPSVRLFRQQEIGDWNSVISGLVEGLATHQFQVN